MEVDKEEVDTAQLLLSFTSDSTCFSSSSSSSSLSSHSSISSSSLSTSSGRPSIYARHYSEDDLVKCLQFMQRSNLHPDKASSQFHEETGILIPPSTLRSRVCNLGSSSALTDGTYVAHHGSAPNLTSLERPCFADWIRQHSNACLCLSKELLNEKVIEIAAQRGHIMKSPPSKPWWHDFFKEVCLV